MRTRRGSSSNLFATSAIGSLVSTRTARSSVSYSSTAPTSVRSEVALPPTATAWAGWSTSTPVEEVVDVVAQGADLGRRGRVVGQELLGDRAGADLERAHLAHAVGDRAEDDLRGAAADVDDADLALDRMAERLGRADEREPALLLLAQDLDRQPGGLGDLLRRLLGVLGLADRRGGDDPDRLRPELLGEPHLGGDDLGELGDLLVGDLALALRVLVEARVGALLHHLAQLALLRLGDEHAGGVRADVDRRAEHASDHAKSRG